MNRRITSPLQCLSLVFLVQAACVDPTPLTVTDASSAADSAGRADAADSGFSGACAADIGMCNFISGSGCQTGRGCYRVRDTETLCTNIGSGDDGATCDPANGDLDCRPGFFCDRLRHVCSHYCCDDSECSGGAAGGPRICFHDVHFPGSFGFCAYTCDFYSTTNMCPTDSSRCSMFQTHSGYSPLCHPSTRNPPVTTGGSCTDDTDCVSGHVCAANFCRRLCAPNNLSAHPCPTGQRCVASTDPNFGACI